MIVKYSTRLKNWDEQTFNELQRPDENLAVLAGSLWTVHVFLKSPPFL